MITVFLTVIFTMSLSYKQYIADAERNKKNWEISFFNIPYSDSQMIKNADNIKEISIIRKIGETENLSNVDNLTVKFDIRAYDANAIKNSNIHIIEGRMPSNENEVLISSNLKNNKSIKENINLGDVLQLEVNGNIINYTVVRQSR